MLKQICLNIVASGWVRKPGASIHCFFSVNTSELFFFLIQGRKEGLPGNMAAKVDIFKSSSLKLTKSTKALPTKTKAKLKLWDNLILFLQMLRNSCQTQHNWNQNEIGCWGLTKFPELENQHSAVGLTASLIAFPTPS